MAKNESFDAIITEMRRRSQEAYEGQTGYPECWRNQIDYDEVDDWIDRIEAAVKRAKQPGNDAAMREALADLVGNIEIRATAFGIFSIVDKKTWLDAKAALAAPARKGKWKNGRNYEYEYAYCSECGRMQWAGWDSHKQAEENIESFSDDYRFCPGCGAEMEGGEYVK